MNRQTKRSLAALAVAAAVGFSGAAVAALIDRGGGLIYDDVLNITWLANANLAATEAFGLTRSENVFPSFGAIEIGSTGRMSWFTADAWITAMNTADYLGYDDWRLASMSVSGGVPTGSASSVVNCATSTEVACRDNELGYMYYYNLTPSGDTPPTNSGTNLTGNQGPFTNIQSAYWSGTEYAPLPGYAWFFLANYGYQYNAFKNYHYYAWAVRSGDVVAAVPEPASIALVGLGLVGLGWMWRRRG